MRAAFAITLLVCAMGAQAGTYRCDTAQGTTFSDQPCGPDAETLNITPPPRSGLSLDSGDITVSSPRSRKRDRTTTSQEGCSAGYIQSTRLRRYRVQEHIEIGMSEEQVRYILGRPDSRDGPWWVYMDNGEEVGRYRFARGCLQRWR